MLGSSEEPTKLASAFDDIKALAAWAKTTRSTRIFVDGDCGVGKSFVAKQLGQFGFESIDCDEFLKPGTGEYLAAIDYSALQRKILTFGAAPVVLSCICARDVAHKLGLSYAKFIYVVLVRPDGIEHTCPALDAERDGTEKVDSRLVPTAGTASHEAFQYHIRVSPHSNADAIYRNKLADN